MSSQRKFSRRQVLKLGASAASALALSGCRTLLDRLDILAPTVTPRAVSPLPTATADSALNRSAIAGPLNSAAPPVQISPIETPQPTATPAPPRWIAPPNGSKLGLHATFGPRDGLDDFLARCAQSGHPVAVVKCVDDFEPAFKAKDHSAQTLTVGRVNAVGLNNHDFVDMQAWEPPEFSPAIGVAYTSAQDAARVYFDLVKPTWKLNPVIDVWETFNEFSNHWGWQADFYIALMDLAEAEGYRLGLWSPSAGNPPEDAYPEIARACRRAKEHGNHILCLHEYGLDGLLRAAPKTLVTRYRQLYKYLAEVEAVIPLVISEAGENAGGGFTGIETFMDDFTWYDRQMSKDDYVIGCAMWTLGDWNGANFQAALPALAAYISGQPVTWYHTQLPLIMREAGPDANSPELVVTPPAPTP